MAGGLNDAPFALTEYVAATPTVFKDDLSLDYDAVDEQAAYLSAMGIRSAFVGGTTGESMSLSVAERKLLAERWRAASTKHNLTIVVHVGTSTPVEAAELAAHAQSIKADSIAAMAPFFFKPTSAAAVVDYLAAIGAAAPDVPLYYYHIPSMTGVNVPVADILATGGLRVPSLRGAKFSDPDLYEFGRCTGLTDTKGRPYNLLYGKDEMLLGALAIGADGAVGSTYNIPFLRPAYADLWSAWARGDLEAARKAQHRSRQVVQLMHTYGDGTLKAMLSFSKVPAGSPRPPLSALSSLQRAQLKAALVSEGFLDDELTV